jgi:hypothetical protein
MGLKDQIRNSRALQLVQEVKAKARRHLHLYRSGCEAPLHCSEGVQPFFIVGSGRAGTTLLRRILQASDEIHIPPEIWSFKDTYTHFLRYRSILSWGDLISVLVCRRIARGDFEPSFRRKGVSIIQGLIDLPTNERSLARVIDAINRQHGHHQGATFSRWGDKTPLNSFCLEEIVEVFPDAKFIHMIRDPADVIRSYLERKEIALDNLRTAVGRWDRAVQSVINFGKKNEQVIEIRYEDLVSHPEAETESICEFLGLNFRPSWLGRTDHFDEIDEVAGRDHHANVFEPISTKHVGKGRRELSTEALHRLDSLIGEKVEQLGYEPIA